MLNLWFVAYVLVGLLALLLVLYLLSTRKSYSIRAKHVLITGGSSGIGKALAAEAIQRGVATVTLLARNKEKLQTAKTELEALIPKDSQQKVHVVSADVSSLTVKDALQDAVNSNGQVDVLVNCAGIAHTELLHDTPPETFEEILHVNVLGCVYSTQALLPAMMDRRAGGIVFISSQAGQLGLHGYSAYSASKYALRGLAEVLRMEMAPYNVGISVSFPPDTDTPQFQAEQTMRTDVEKELASYGAVFKAPDIAKDIWNGVEKRKFQITHGFDGFILGTLNAGMSPVTHTWDALVQVFLMGLFRAVSLFYLMVFYRIVRKGVQHKKKHQ